MCIIMQYKKSTICVLWLNIWFYLYLFLAELPEGSHTQPLIAEADFKILRIFMIILNSFKSFKNVEK